MTDDLRDAVAATARMLSRAGLVEAFGHVSARVGEGAVITSVLPLARCRAADTVVVDADGIPSEGPGEHLPLEAPMHLALYRARPDVMAICRGHPPAAVVWGTGTTELPLRHGLGALAGARVPVHPDVALVTDSEAGDAVARTLGGHHALLLRGNGALAVGSSLGKAAVRLWYLEQRARVATSAPDDGSAPSAWEPRLAHTAEELRRAIRWFVDTFGDEASP
jgi:HCOMODA/2-hydroxy-3-carboxy-muconic semialdehyde decarboxylase